MLYEFCSKFHTLSSSAKIFKNRLRFDKVTESSKVGTFLRHSVEIKQPSKIILADYLAIVGFPDLNTVRLAVKINILVGDYYLPSSSALCRPLTR